MNDVYCHFCSHTNNGNSLYLFFAGVDPEDQAKADANKGKFKFW